jgi:flagellar protein FlaG
MEIANTRQPFFNPANSPSVEVWKSSAEQAQLRQAARELNAAQQFGPENELTFVIDRDSRQLLTRIVNRETRELVRQIPPEYVLRLAEDLRQQRNAESRR